jgi:cyanophycinase
MKLLYIRQNNSMRNIFFSFLLLTACAPEPAQTNVASAVEKSHHSGQLYIIGGGQLHLDLMSDMLTTGGIAKEDLIVVIPAASEEPDTAIYYDSKPFIELGYTNVKPLRLSLADSVKTMLSDSLAAAKAIFLCGGDQLRLMSVIGQPNLLEILHQAYANGAVIGGTSAGAAVMSKIMITGDQKKELEYESTYRRLKSGNGMYSQGTGLFSEGIIDQHFIERSRYNRALTALFEFPDKTVYGIGESTALRISPEGMFVHGSGQIVTFTAPQGSRLKEDLIGFPKIEMTVYLPGDTIR